MSGMVVYFARRLMLVPITFLVITCMVYSILRIVPGGPIEQAETMMKLAATSGEGGGGGGAGDEAGMQLDEDAMRELEEYYALDRGILVGYLQWLGLWPRTAKTRVPPVPVSKNAKAVERLRAAAAAVQAAKDALGAHLAEREVVAQDGRLWQKPAQGEVPPAVQKAAGLLVARTFGERYALRDYLQPLNLAWVDDALVRPLDAPEADPWATEGLSRLAALEEARQGQRQVEQETGYWLDEASRPLQAAFRTLHALNDVRAKAAERLEALLEPETMIARAGLLYRRVEQEERESAGKQAFFDEAEELVNKGFGKRDELLAFLADHGYTWRGNQYYRLLTDEEAAGREELLTSARALIAAQHLANGELARIEEEQRFRITPEGRVYVLESKRSGILQLDFGQSYSYNEPVLSLIGSKMEVSIQFGLIGYFLTWIVCVPLGVFKAIKHRSMFDSVSSVIVFLGYSIPGFVLCLILLSSVAVHIDWLPLGGYKPDNIEDLGWWDSVVGRIRHMLIPVAGYMITQFAGMTILMKNSLLENLGQDYVRTAFAKGLSEKRVIFVHALRNSLIPITSGIGHALALLFAGSFLIEKACNIDGMGLLGFNAILSRDYPIILGLLVLLVLIQLTGNILSDIIWALIDPRIRFGR